MINFHLLRKTLNLDIFDLNYVYSERMNIMSLPQEALPRAGRGVRVTSFLYHMLANLLRPGHLFSFAAIPKESILFFACSKNQYDALQPVMKQTSLSLLVTGHQFWGSNRFPEFWAFLISIFFLPVVIRDYFGASPFQKKSFRYGFDQYLLTYGYYFVAELWLQNVSPKSLVISNDHNMRQRVLIKAATDLEIPTIYLQHASVSTRFPPLSFDYALLDGVDASQKYDQVGGSSTVVFLVGIPKMDGYFKYVNQHAKARAVGICTNTLDPIPAVDALCTQIRDELPNLSITIRPHPSDRRLNEWHDLAQRHNTEFSDARTELSFEFLTSVDSVIVGESNILLEAILMNVYPIYYDFRQKKNDSYGFLRNGLTEYNSHPNHVTDRLRTLMKSKPDVQMKASAYCGTLGTIYAGSSSMLASELIRSIASGEEIDMEMWRRVPSSSLIAYELGRPENKAESPDS